MSEPVKAGASLDELTAKLSSRAFVPDPDPIDGVAVDDETLDFLDGAEADAVRWSRAIPSRFGWATLGHVSGPSRGRLERWAVPPVGNLVLTGGIGTGKSFAAVAAVRPLFDRGREVLFTSVPIMLDRLRAEFDRPGPRTLMDEVCEVDVLVLDDLGTEKRSEWTDERLYMMVNERWMNSLPTVATMNLSRAEMSTHIDQRTMSRLLGDGATIVSFAGADRRRTAK